MRDVVIVEAVRTPVGRRNGKLKGVHPNVLGATVLQELMRRAKIDAAQVEFVVMGCVDQVGEQGFNVARNIVLQAGYPIDIAATSVDLQCGSSQQALHIASDMIRAGGCDIAVAAGVESMTRVPMGSNISNGPGTPFHPDLMARYNLVPQGLSAEMIAEQWGVTREEADKLSLRSHQLAAKATDAGYFRREIVPLKVNLEDGSEQIMSEDEGIRRETTRDKLAALKLAFKEDGVITAGNSSQISDGAAAILLMSREKASELGLRPRARIVQQLAVGVDPVTMLTGPIPATKKILQRAGLKLEDIDLIEINEAFATVVLAWQKELEPDMDRVNVNGGAIAMGHPLGCSGARLATTLLHELERRGSRYGLQTMCCGGGIGIATIIERES